MWIGRGNQEATQPARPDGHQRAVAIGSSFIVKTDDDLIHDIIEKKIVSKNICVGVYSVKDANIFFKYCPLLDPVKYMMGKYEENDNFDDLDEMINKKWWKWW